MARKATSELFVGNCGLVALLLCSSVLMQVDLVKGDNGWNPHQLAQDFCDRVAVLADTDCTCVDTGDGACKYKEHLGGGLDVMKNSFSGITENFPSPPLEVYHVGDCDARKSKSNVYCTLAGDPSSVKGTAPLIITLGFGLPIELQVDDLTSTGSFPDFHLVLGYDDRSGKDPLEQMSSAVAACKPPKSGQQAGTCSSFEVDYAQVNLDGMKYQYQVSITGGVQMGFGKSIDAAAVIGKKSNGQPHFQWWFSIAQIVQFGKSSAGNLPNMEAFDTPDPDRSDAVTYHSFDAFGPYYVDVLPTCYIHNCD